MGGCDFFVYFRVLAHKPTFNHDCFNLAGLDKIEIEGVRALHSGQERAVYIQDDAIFQCEVFQPRIMYFAAPHEATVDGYRFPVRYRLC
jgi:hypothetical protein